MVIQWTGHATRTETIYRGGCHTGALLLRGGLARKPGLEQIFVSLPVSRHGQLNLQSYIPKPIPDDQNFAATPVVKRWFVKQSANVPFNSDHFSKAPTALIQLLKNVEKKKNLQHLDLVAWQNGLKDTSANSVAVEAGRGSSTVVEEGGGGGSSRRTWRTMMPRFNRYESRAVGPIFSIQFITRWTILGIFYCRMTTILKNSRLASN